MARKRTTNGRVRCGGSKKKPAADEYYTRMCDIEKELVHYRHLFNDKVVYLPCDEPLYSSFYTYFADNFASFNLRKLIVSYYSDGRPTACTAMERAADGSVSNTQTLLMQGGDFRSEECRLLFEEADIVVTFPPQSMIFDFLGVIESTGVDYLIVAPDRVAAMAPAMNLIRAGRAFPGVNNIRMFHTPTVIEDGEGKCYLLGTLWMTSLRPDASPKTWSVSGIPYSPDRYPRYANADAVEVSRCDEIPSGYDGLMGVPLSFFKHWDPDEFEIVDIIRNHYDAELLVESGLGDLEFGLKTPLVKTEDGFRVVYDRTLIRRRKDDSSPSL